MWVSTRARIASIVQAVMILLLATVAHAQTNPHIGSLFPSGARVGQTVDVTFKGGGLTGVQRLLVSGGDGVSAQFSGGANAIDETARPVFQSKCTSCHEARSPDNRSMTGEQWASTVSRMITQHGADIKNADRDKIVGYLQGLAKAGEITAKITVEANAAPGLREIRLLTSRGVSSATAFEVGNIAEMLAPAAAASGKPEDAPVVTLPIVINGVLAQSGERDSFQFDARKGERLTFNLKAERLNAEEATYFFPTLYIYDLNGKELTKNLGKDGVDPIVDFVAPAAGRYRVLVRDLLYHGTPGSVYRLTIGDMPADGALSPGWARPGENLNVHLASVALDPTDVVPVPASFSLHAPTETDGMTMVATPAGLAPLLIRDLPDGGGPSGAEAPPVALPALFCGELARPGKTDTFHVHAARGGANIEMYAQRLGSPMMPAVTVKDATGSVTAQRTATGEEDIRLQNAFPRAGDYTVEVTDADGNGGSGYVYCFEASSGVPDLQLSVSPDTANISAGASMTLLVKAVRRQNVNGPIKIHARGLPAGITAADATLLPGMNEAALVLTASPTATSGVGGFFSIEAEASAADVPPAKPASAAPDSAAKAPLSIRRVASPIEVFALGNQTIRVPRTTSAVAIRSDPPSFTIDLASGARIVTVTPGKDISIPVKIQRESGFKGGLFLAAQGLPPGITASQQTFNVSGDKSEATIVLHVAKDYPAFKAADGAATTPTPQFAIAGFLATLNNDYVPTVTTGPLAITLSP